MKEKEHHIRVLNQVVRVVSRFPTNTIHLYLYEELNLPNKAALTLSVLYSEDVEKGESLDRIISFYDVQQALKYSDLVNAHVFPNPLTDDHLKK